MKVLGAETTVRFHIAVDGREVEALRALGVLPPNCAIPALLSVTPAELDEYRLLLPGLQLTTEGLIHVLHLGRALCRFNNDVPRLWPVGHTWVRLGDQESAATAGNMCPGCLHGARLEHWRGARP